jgi:hypothetical protein
MFSSAATQSLSESPSLVFTSGGDIFTKYFYRKSVLTLAVKLTEDLMRGQSYSDNAVSFAADAVYLAIITLQGSIQTSGSGYAATTLMQLAGYSNDSAWWGGYAVSLAVCLALDMTPWGVFFTTIATLGGEFGKDTAATLYASAKRFCEEIKQDYQALDFA